MDRFHSAEHVAGALAPSIPVICHRPHAAARAAAWFADQFPGDVFYAVKANPTAGVLDAVSGAGIDHFDVASIAEVRDVRSRYPNATLAYMHPIKAFEDIAEAYFEHGVRIFALDDEAELDRLIAATGKARDLTLCVRLSVENAHAKMALNTKFGVRGDAAAHLLRQTRAVAARCGVSFHVGSQTMAPAAFSTAMAEAREIVVRSGVLLDIVDVGGGFPAPYPGMQPPMLDGFVAEIRDQFMDFPSTRDASLWCEPGRAISAEAASLLVRVERRRGQDLYINDGVYGVLYDAGHFAWRYPVRSLAASTAPNDGFRFFGPTCDDADVMPGPFLLPKTITDGDYIEVGMVGAYGQTMASRFNGYGAYIDVACTDDPFGTHYLNPTRDAQVEGTL